MLFRSVEAAGLGDRYGHGLGHGVGLDVHEAPVLRPETVDVLVSGNVVSVEPGIYLPGRFGVRLEDLVVVEPDRARRLNDAPFSPVLGQDRPLATAPPRSGA